METKGFENVRDQIGFCGIWCGSCTAGNGAILELTKKYQQTIQACNLEKWAPKNFDFKEFSKGLASIQTMSLCPGCKKNGGNQTCKIRTCASEKRMTDCSQCSTLSKCTNFKQLESSHPNIKQELTEMKNTNRTKLMRTWTDELKRKWPHCLLLCDSTK